MNRNRTSKGLPANAKMRFRKAFESASQRVATTASQKTASQKTPSQRVVTTASQRAKSTPSQRVVTTASQRAKSTASQRAKSILSSKVAEISIKNAEEVVKQEVLDVQDVENVLAKAELSKKEVDAVIDALPEKTEVSLEEVVVELASQSIDKEVIADVIEIAVEDAVAFSVKSVKVNENQLRRFKRAVRESLSRKVNRTVYESRLSRIK